MGKIKIRHTRTAYLNGEVGEKLFKHYWVTMGTGRSLGGLRRFCEAEGILNPVLHTPPSLMGLEKAIYRWAIQNVEKSYEIFNTSQRDEGNFHTLPEWRDFLRDKFRSAYQYDDNQRKKFLKKAGYEI